MPAPPIPVEPSKEMLEALEHEIYSTGTADGSLLYKALKTADGFDLAMALIEEFRQTPQSPVMQVLMSEARVLAKAQAAVVASEILVSD